jgi:ribosomal protein S8
MTLRNNIILIFTIVLFGCGEDKKAYTNKNEQESSTIIEEVDNSITVKEIAESKTENETQANDHLLKIRFEEFSIEIDSVEVWDEEGKLKEQQKDTAKIYLELGETIEGQILKVHKIKKGEIRIYQRFENSVTVMNEGPHCDLTEWKHYNSDWKELKIENGQFLTDSYSEEDWERFIEVDMTELREAVREQCGDGWAEHVKNVKSPNEYPCGVSTSRIFFKITFSEQDKVIERIVSFEIPMGC